MSKLHIANNLSLPLEAVTQTFGILAMRGAGKTNTGRVMAEEMFKAKLPFVAIDPVGSWWGLRSSRDGTGPGLPIPIFGGRHGDVPLEKHSGKLMAELIAQKRLSCVLDVSEFEFESDRKQFLLDFALKLFKVNEDPLHLFLEEADDYIPQKPMGQIEPWLLRAWENIVKRGRSRGLGVTVITQRSAAINKNVLTQIGTLIAMRITSPQDRDAVKEWVKYHRQSEALLESLSTLHDGEAWVWSPQFLKLTKRVRFRLSNTFDSGATPTNVTASSKRAPATMADIDLEAIKMRMAETIERAKAEDPRELRKRIFDLEKKLKEGVKAGPVSRLDSGDTGAGGKGKGRELTEEKRADYKKKGFEQGVAAERRRIRGEVDPLLKSMRTRLESALPVRVTISMDANNNYRAELGGDVLKDLLTESFEASAALAKTAPVPEAPAEPARAAASPSKRIEYHGGEKVTIHEMMQRATDFTWNRSDTPKSIGKGPRGILLAIAQRASGATQKEIAIVTGYKPTSRRDYCGELLRLQLVERGPGDKLIATKAGVEELGADFKPLPAGSELRDFWLQNLPQGEKRIFEFLCAAYPRTVTRDQVQEGTGYKATSVRDYLGDLAARELIEFPGRGEVRASSELFEDQKHGQGA